MAEHVTTTGMLLSPHHIELVESVPDLDGALEITVQPSARTFWRSFRELWSIPLDADDYTYTADLETAAFTRSWEWEDGDSRWNITLTDGRNESGCNYVWLEGFTKDGAHFAYRDGHNLYIDFEQANIPYGLEEFVGHPFSLVLQWDRGCSYEDYLEADNALEQSIKSPSSPGGRHKVAVVTREIEVFSAGRVEYETLELDGVRLPLGYREIIGVVWLQENEFRFLASDEAGQCHAFSVEI